MRLIEELKQYYLERRMSQGELAKKLGVTVLTINRWFNGKVSPRAVQEYQIKKLLGKGAYSAGDSAAVGKVKEEDICYYGNPNSCIEQIKLIKDATTGEEEIFISYVSEKKGRKIRKITLSGKELVKLIEKHK